MKPPIQNQTESAIVTNQTSSAIVTNQSDTFEHEHGNFSPKLRELWLENQALKAQNVTLTKKVEALEKELQSIKEGKIPRKDKIELFDKIVTNKQFGFTKAQIDILVSEKERKRSNLWSDSDFSKAMKVRCISIGALKTAKKLVPLPSSSLLQRKFAHLHVTKGYIRPVLQYLTKKGAKWTEIEKICGVCFDELGSRVYGDIDRYLDLFVPPAKNIFGQFICF